MEHHQCSKCQVIFFCPQTKIDLGVTGCKYNNGGEHDDYEIECTCGMEIDVGI
jgi:hypothetical protein